MRTYAITGANGYVGSRIAAALKRNGKVRELSRTGDPPFSLGEPIDPMLLRGADVLVHCAWDFRQRSWEDIERVNIQGTLSLFAAARKAGVKRIIFISTMSAFDGCNSKYGRAKLAIEKACRKHHPDVIIVRPGLVYDESPGGIVGKMRGVIRKLPIVPLVGGSARLYLCHSADLGAAVRELSVGRKRAEPVTAAAPQERTFRDILHTLAAQERKKRLFIPVPYALAYAGLWALEALRIPIGLRSDSLVGLVHADRDPRFAKLKTTFREFGASPRRKSRRENL